MSEKIKPTPVGFISDYGLDKILEGQARFRTVFVHAEQEKEFQIPIYAGSIEPDMESISLRVNRALNDIIASIKVSLLENDELAAKSLDQERPKMHKSIMDALVAPSGDQT